MTRVIVVPVVLLLLSVAANAQDGAEAAAGGLTAGSEPSERPDEAPAPAGTSPDQPRTLSGISILGNEEAPKSLVIVPWKSSELGDDLDLTDTLDDRARPVDKEVFLRELNYYAIRSGK